MIFTGNESISFSDDLPEKVDVAIIGGGVAGVSAAWFLAEAGQSVTIIEKGRIACEQSSRNWGWVRQQGRDSAELPIMMASIRHWAEINEKLGPGIGFQKTGTLYIASNEAELAGYEQWLDVARPHQLDTRLVTRPELNKLVEGNNANWIGGLHTASDGRAEPFTAVPSMANYLHQQKRVRIREACAARCLDMEAGNVSGVWTEHGLIKANAVLLTGGAWCSTFLANHNIPLPQLTVRSTVARTEPIEPFYHGNAVDSQFAFRLRQDGGYTIAPGGYSEHYVGLDSLKSVKLWKPVLQQSFKSVRLTLGNSPLARFLPRRQWNHTQITPFERHRVLNPKPSRPALRHMRAQLKQNLPMLAEVPFTESWAGMIDVMPDVVPVMDAIDSHPGLFLGTGFSGHGFGFGPGAGKVLASKVLGEPDEFDLDRFRYQRFFDGTPMVPGPGL